MTRWFFFFLLPLILTSCEGSFQRRVLREWNALVIIVTGHPSSWVEGKKGPTLSETEGLFSANAARAKANAEILGEMVRVVLAGVTFNAAEFGNLVDSLNQGASFEGIYNGFVHSGRYRRLEIEYPRTSLNAISTFSDELVLIENDLKQKSEFDLASTLSLRVMDPTNPGADDPRLKGVHDFSKPVVVGVPGKASLDQAQAVQKLFSKSSIFTLKRVLGEEILKVVDEKKTDRQGLATWYSRWAVRMSVKKVDFGLSLRNSPDEKFHFEWAMKASFDQLQWEILNRVHRILNQAHEKKA